MEELYCEIKFETKMTSFELKYLLKQYGLINASLTKITENEVVMSCLSSKDIIDDFKEQINDILFDFNPDISNIIISTRAKNEPYHVSKITLPDGSIFSGEVLDKDGVPIPEGFGKRKYKFGPRVNGFYSKGLQNGACYVNNHYSMILSNFKDGKPYGWGMSIDGHGSQFGVIMNDDYVISLNDHLSWIIILLDGKTNPKGGLITYFRNAGEILYGYQEQDLNGNYITVKGAHFMKNGDVYFGTDCADLSKTGVFVKYKHEGYIEIGEYKNGVLQTPITLQELINYYWPSFYSENGIRIKYHSLKQKLLSLEIDTEKKYF